jgi:hypothetical protein
MCERYLVDHGEMFGNGTGRRHLFDENDFRLFCTPGSAEMMSIGPLKVMSGMRSPLWF